MTMKKIIKRFLILMITVSVLAMLLVSPTLYRGIKLYQGAVDSVPIINRVEQIKSDSNYVSIDKISPAFIHALVLEEDHRFYEHPGFSLVAIGRALKTNIKAGARLEGGSSITQQLAKNMYYSFEKTYERKVAELITALELERLLTKEEILELYCNIVYFGEGCYGIQAASQFYFNVDALNLDEESALLLVKTLKSPSQFNPNQIKNE